MGQNISSFATAGPVCRPAANARAASFAWSLPTFFALKQNSKLLEHVSPELMRGGVKVKSPFNSATLQMSGIWPIFQTIRTIEVDRGRCWVNRITIQSDA